MTEQDAIEIDSRIKEDNEEAKALEVDARIKKANSPLSKITEMPKELIDIITKEDSPQENADDEEQEAITIDDLPLPVLRSKLKEQNIKFLVKDKRKDLIKMLTDGKTIHKPKERKRAPKLGENKLKKALPIVPKEIRESLERLAKRGLTWDVDEDSCCINFKRDIETCANLDQPAKNILKTAQNAFGGNAPLETGKLGKIGQPA